MPVSRRLVALAAAGALAAPASALGQSAGDEQYQDPFAGQDQGQSQGGGSEAPAAPAPATPEAPAPAPAAEPASTGEQPGATAQTELPYTGADAGAIVLAGAILLAGGIALRVRLRERS